MLHATRNSNNLEASFSTVCNRFLTGNYAAAISVKEFRKAHKEGRKVCSHCLSKLNAKTKVQAQKQNTDLKKAQKWLREAKKSLAFREANPNYADGSPVSELVFNNLREDVSRLEKLVEKLS